jgi:hypothetical protein
MVAAPNPLDAALGRRNDLVKALTGEVGQLHALEAGPRGSTGFNSGA